jgi:hypothetical protein
MTNYVPTAPRATLSLQRHFFPFFGSCRSEKTQQNSAPRRTTRHRRMIQLRPMRGTGGFIPGITWAMPVTVSVRERNLDQHRFVPLQHGCQVTTIDCWVVTMYRTHRYAARVIGSFQFRGFCGICCPVPPALRIDPFFHQLGPWTWMAAPSSCSSVNLLLYSCW